MNLLVISLLSAFVIVVAVSRQVDVTVAGEAMGSVYGFPFSWHTKGVTSLSRNFSVGALLLDLLVHALAVFVFMKAIRIASFPRAQKILGVFAVLGFLVCLAAVAISALDPVFSAWFHEMEVVPGSSRLHIGIQFE